MPPPSSNTSRQQREEPESNLSQEEIDRLLSISGFIGDSTQTDRKSLIDEIKDAILDSGKLSLDEWMGLRDRLKEIERLVPTIDLIIELKQKLKKK